jgi:DNA topoisomerase-2
MSSSQNLSKQYQKKTDKQHILDNPDTYIGSVENVDFDNWLYDENKIIQKSFEYIPGLYKLFDEGVVNCRDHVIRMQQKVDAKEPDTLPVTYIDISILEDTITMTNDGNGIDVVKHPEYDIWIPEMIFGHLRTSTNYDKDEKKIVGGKNGFGFKLVLIWSTEGSIETVDHVRKLKYTQHFKNNLDIIEPPTIRKFSGKPYTKISFKPDYKRFKINGLTNDMKKLLERRIYDISGCTSKNIKVKYNSTVLPIKSFVQYIDLYIGNKSESPRVFESANERWEYGVALAPNHEFQQVSFVNGIHTTKGGKHVDYILNQITKKMIAHIEKKKKITVNANVIKEQIILFLRCDIENPAFDSQTKDYMNTPSSKFGSTCIVSDKFIENLAKLGVMEGACAISQVKEAKNAKKTDGIKSKSIRGIPKLIDANWAGTAKSNICTIIFCEGDSAKAGIVSGLSSEDRNTIGVYPMKGKVLNVRGEVMKKITENKEIQEIKKIIGLEANKKYTTENISSLRYGKVLFMTDQDLDGSHIKGLGINLFQSQWESLSKIPGFLGCMNTPILKARKGNETKVFYNEDDYETWKTSVDMKGWNIKYYKGLGTSTGKEFKEYFQEKKIVEFEHHGTTSDDAIDMVFNKKRADDRKEWLSNYDRKLRLDHKDSSISYDDFINKEMIHFSKYDCDRSIPNLMDGLKISLRKILFSAFKKNLHKEIKVAQFSGYVSENSGYHHGEASLNAAIVGMAQNYVGSNNINLFEPNGQFGTRLQGGKDSASERYIFTLLNKITRHIYIDKDDHILEYLDDDGMSVEPTHYLPIIPMILVNGSKGIGTGFSTEILPYNPLTIIDYLQDKLQDKSCDHADFLPYWFGFKGHVIPETKDKFIVKGIFTRKGKDKIHVSELPIGFWTDDFKQLLENLTESVNASGKKVKPYVKDYNDMSQSTNIDVEITFHPGLLDKMNDTEIEKLLKLSTSFSTNNMHLFNEKDKLVKYSSVKQIINDYYEVRLVGYEKRKEYLMIVLSKELKILYNKKRYIEELINDTIDLRKKKKDEINSILENRKYDKMDDDYNYLIKMPMDSVSEENILHINDNYNKKNNELNLIASTTIKEMWLHELEALQKEYNKLFKPSVLL